jgi:ATP-dependent DNA helicase RecG
MLLLNEEAHLKLNELKQAVALEKRHQYIDVMGKRQRFSQFAHLRLKELTEHLLEEETLGKLLARFARYSEADFGFRLHSVEALEAFVYDTLNPKRQQHLSQLQQQASGWAPIATTPVWQIPLHHAKGVGPKLLHTLATLGLNTVEELLYHGPRQYLDYQHHLRIAQVLEGQRVVLVAKVLSLQNHELKNRNLQVLRMKVSDGTGAATASWFFGKKQSGLLHAFKAKHPVGTEVLLSGLVKWDSFNRCPQLDKAEVQVLSYAEEGAAATLEGPQEGTGGSAAPKLLPLYPLTQGLHLKTLRRCIQQALEDFAPNLQEDTLPEGIRQELGLLTLTEALQGLHFPTTLAQAEAARQRLAFDECLHLQLKLLLLKQQYKQSQQGLSLPRKASTEPEALCQRFLESLPFTLTAAQERAFAELSRDLASELPMNRLLHGDVGSGKTLVAALALLVAVENGYQGALMAPTEILAEQHYRSFVEWLLPLGLNVGLLLGKQGAKARKEVRQGLLNGQIQVAIGTHALIQDDVEFANLGVVVVDEQHRFGVRQRSKLRDKGPLPELLSMTATPIPRSLAMTLHGDLDVSVLDELPPGRSPIITQLLSATQRQEAYQRITLETLEGRQAYIVFPLIEESETLAAKAATVEFERLRSEVFPHLRLGLLHGKMKPEEKEAAMHAFVSGQTQVLVATTVVEVGVNVPNATVMVIENAERFGLAQLHQLRGRVGRGSQQSYCLLVANNANEETQERLGIMEQTTNGFVIAEHDLRLRGPGDYLGTRQSGLPAFKFADVLLDVELLAQARQVAQRLVGEATPWQEAYPLLAGRVLHQQQATAALLGSG